MKLLWQTSLESLDQFLDTFEYFYRILKGITITQRPFIMYVCTL